MRRAAGLIGAILALGAGQAAHAAVPAIPSSAQVEALCLARDGAPLPFGTVRGNLGPEPLALAKERGEAAGFEDAIAVYTPWSDRLMAVDYVLDVPGGDPLGSWSDAFVSALAAAGWEKGEDTSYSFIAARLDKTFATAAGPRRLAIELDLHGERRGITVRCAEAELMVVANDERDGVLAPGSPRPLAPPAGEALAAYLARLDCTDPALLALFEKTERLEDAGTLVEARLGPPLELRAQSEYQSRLVTWLRWRLRQSGKLDQEAIWAIEDRVAAQAPAGRADDLPGFIGTFGKVLDAQKAGDMAALCRSYRDTIVAMAEDDAREARGNAALAAAFEAEASRQGIALD